MSVLSDAEVVTIPERAVVVLRGLVHDDFGNGEWRGPGREMIDALAKTCGHRDFLIVVLSAGQSLQVLDEEAMREHGWVRAG